MPEKYAGADWIAHDTSIKLSQLGQEVADILGQAWKGIYHIKSAALKVDWGNPHWISINVRVPLCTFDDDLLTRLIVLCNDRLIRLQIEGIGPGYLRLTFHQRNHRHGRLYDRIPYIENHIEQIRSEIGMAIIADMGLPAGPEVE